MTERSPELTAMAPAAPLHFIFAAPRSGTTWLMRALNRHPEILAVEQRLFGHFCEVWPDNDGRQRARQTWDYVLQNFAHHYAESHLGMTAAAEQRAAFQRDLATRFFDFLLDYGLQRSGKRVIVDKITPYLGTAGAVLGGIASYFPQAKIIYLLRDGRDVATSGAFDWLARGDRTSAAYRYFVDQSSSTYPSRLFETEFLSQWCQYWKEPAAALEHRLRQGEFAGQILTVHYEEMLADQSIVLQQVCRFLQLDDRAELCRQCAAAVTFEKTTARKSGDAIPTAKARKGIHGDWQNYFTRADADLFQSQCGHWLHHYGYATDPQWVAQCPAVLERPS